MEAAEYDEYKRKVFDFLERMPTGSTYVVDTVCRQENKVVFVELVKEYITLTRIAYSNGVEFTNDFSRIRKTDVTGLPRLY